MPTDLDIFRAITYIWMISECEMFIKNYSQNLVLLISSIVADPILILLKFNSFLYEKIIYFVLSALIHIYTI